MSPGKFNCFRFNYDFQSSSDYAFHVAIVIKKVLPALQRRCIIPPPNGEGKRQDKRKTRAINRAIDSG